MKQPKQDAFLDYMLCLNTDERALVEDLFSQMKRQLRLGKKDNAAIRQDFENALLYYAQSGTPLMEALSRLAPTRMGGFYAREASLWYPLDSAAKVYPLSMGHGKMAVFRLSACLKAPVVPAILQTALTFTVGRFPTFATNLKVGFFWHYLDAWKGRYAVEEETAPPCRALKIGRTGQVPFRVLYRENRISVEFFHILTDGTGGMVFLKTLLGEYLRLLGVDCPTCDGVLDVTQPFIPEETVNEFPRVLREKVKGGFADKGALQLGSPISRVNPCQVLRFKMDAEKLLAQAKQRDATVTAYLTSKVLCACRAATENTRGEFSVQIPVNLRKFYPSRTLRNFALYCGIRFPAEEISSPDALLGGIRQQMAEKASRQALDKMVASTENLVMLARYLPLPVKHPVVQAVYGVLGDRIFTTTLSNLGVVTMPQEMAEHVQDLDFVLGTARVNRVLCSVVTFGNTASFSIAKQTKDPTFEETLLRLLQEDGLLVEVEGSEVYEY